MSADYVQHSNGCAHTAVLYFDETSYKLKFFLPLYMPNNFYWVPYIVSFLLWGGGYFCIPENLELCSGVWESYLKKFDSLKCCFL